MIFNVPGGECFPLGHLLRTWPPDMCSKNYLTVFPRATEVRLACPYPVISSCKRLVNELARMARSILTIILFPKEITVHSGIVWRDKIYGEKFETFNLNVCCHYAVFLVPPTWDLRGWGIYGMAELTELTEWRN